MATSSTEERSSTGAQSRDNHSTDAVKDETEEAPAADRKSSLLSRIWIKSGLNIGMLMMMVKGALPPTISLAIYQSTSVAKIYSTLGYLVAIMSVLSFAILPRSKYIQTMTLNVVAVCVGAAVALLEVYCSTQARIHTTPAPAASSAGPSPGAKVSQYNSSAAAVCAIWLFFNIYIVNTLRASRPQFQFPAIVYSIFANVASIYAPSFPTMAAGIAFTERLLEAFLTGFAIATGVSLFIFPITVRMTFFKQSTGFIQLVQGTLKAQLAYLQSLEKPDALALPDNEVKEGHHFWQKDQTTKAGISLEAKNLKTAIAGLGEIQGKIHADIAFAKREMAWGKLNASDISEVAKLLQGIFLPLSGMGSTADIFQRVAEKWVAMEAEGPSSKQEVLETLGTRWNRIMKSLHEPFETMTNTMNDGLEHALYTLELTKAPTKKRPMEKSGHQRATEDIESQAGSLQPGDLGYAKYLEQKVDGFYEKRKTTLAAYCQQKGLSIDGAYVEKIFDFVSKSQIEQDALSDQDYQSHQGNQRQLFLVLYMEFLLWSTGRAVLDLAKFAEQKVEDGTLKKKRLILPGLRRSKKWLVNLLKGEDEGVEHTPDLTESGGAGIYSGQSFEAAKDPEHLPPTNAWQRFGNGFRSVGGILGSVESAFGFRVACATLSIGIVAFLADSRNFFLEQRIVWAMIMVSIGMTLTAGSGVFGFLGRIVGTFIAMCTSLVIWYIVDGHPAGVIVFLFVFVFAEFYFIMAYPRFIVVALLSIVTQVLIIGYELEVKKVGLAVATSNGQPYYQIYLLAPYRLACVSGGMLVAFIWTFFPYPLTARSQLRRDLGASLYLLANFYSIVHTTVDMRVNAMEGDMEAKGSPGRKLEKARSEVYVKELGLLAGLRQHSAFTVFEPSLGGKFPRPQYDAIIQEVSSILNYLALISYASRSLVPEASESSDQRTWIQDFSRLIGSITTTSQEITSVLALLSAAVTDGNSLPPYLKAPASYQLSEKLERLDSDILSITHIAEPGYSAFAVMQIASSLVCDDLRKLIDNVKALVGEVDFSFHVISTADSSEETLFSKNKQA